MSQEAQQSFHPQLNGGKQAHEVGSCDERQNVFCCRCERHITICTAKTVKDNPAVLNCRQCMHAAGQKIGRPVSSYEARAWQVFTETCAGPLLVEIRLLGQKHAPADLYYPFEAGTQTVLDLLIMIDGEGHSTKPHHGKTIAEQQASDRATEAACIAAGRNLLRLDYRDKEDWGMLMQDAVYACKDPAGKPFLMYSRAYVLDSCQDALVPKVKHDTGKELR